MKYLIAILAVCIDQYVKSKLSSTGTHAEAPDLDSAMPSL